MGIARHDPARARLRVDVDAEPGQPRRDLRLVDTGREHDQLVAARQPVRQERRDDVDQERVILVELDDVARLDDRGRGHGTGVDHQDWDRL